MSIDVKELMIGDWVDIDGISYTVNGALLAELEKSTCTYKKSVSPIPLTPDILEKCGLKRQPQQNKYGIVGFEIFIVGDKYLWARQTDKFGDIKEYKNKPIEVKSLHRLQNLYKLVMNTELKINL